MELSKNSSRVLIKRDIPWPLKRSPGIFLYSFDLIHYVRCINVDLHYFTYLWPKRALTLEVQFHVRSHGKDGRRWSSLAWRKRHDATSNLAAKQEASKSHNAKTCCSHKSWLIVFGTDDGSSEYREDVSVGSGSSAIEELVSRDLYNRMISHMTSTQVWLPEV